MALQPFLKISSFTGNSQENFDEFESLLRAGITVGAVDQANQASFLKLNLSGGALRYYSSLPQATQNDLELSLTALRDRYNQTANQEFHRIRFHERKFDSAKESPEDYIVDLQNLAAKAFPNIPAAQGVGGVNRADERTRRVKEAFIQGMPLKFKRKLLKEPPERTVDELGRVITKEMWILKTYPDDGYPGAFNQVRSEQDSSSITMATLNAFQDRQEKMYNNIQKRMDALAGHVEQSVRALQASNSGQSSYRPRQNYHNQGYHNTNNQQDRQRNQQWHPPSTQGRANSPHPNRNLFCRRCGKNGHSQGRCYQQPQQRSTGQSIPYDNSKN